MSRLARAAALPRQLAGALRRNGVRNVWRFGANMVARHGVVSVLRYAIAPPALRRARLEQMEEGPVMRPAPSAPAGDFAADGRVAAERWERLAAVRRAAGPAVDGDGAGVHLVFGSTEAPAAAADDEWVVLLRPGDAPSPRLRPRVALAGAQPCLQLVTFDSSFVDADGGVHPILQPGVNPWLARYADVGFGRYAFRAGLLRAGDGDGHARLRRWIAARGLNDARDRWAHVFEPLLEVALAPGDVAAARAEAIARARAAPRPGTAPERVSVVICTHNRGRLLRQLVRALDDPRIAEVLVVANNTTSPPALETLEWVGERPRCRVLVRDEPFNFSRLANTGAALATGDRLLFLNDDITPVSDDWLEPLLQPLRDPDVGVAGPLLLYPNESVQHAGVFLGFRGHAGHSLRHVRLPEQDYLFYGSLPREMSAVTGAAMMVRRDLFEALNGFDELLPTFLQDVDFCLRARAVGLASVWTPLAELIHMESASMKEAGGAAFDHAMRTRERDRFLTRWGGVIAEDPLRNPAFDVNDESQRTLA